MKKVLLASTALVGAAALMAAPAAAEVTVSAFSQFHISGGDEDLDNTDKDFDFITNTEIHFNGSAETDNGLTFGFRIELEGDSDVPAFVDENSVFVSGSFGKVELGSNDGPGDTFMVNGSYVGIQNGGIGNPTFSAMTAYNVSSAPTSVDPRESGDAPKISYFSPRFSGFQFGVAYAPDTDNDGDARGFNPSGQDAAGQIEDVIELGANFSDTINGIAVDLGAVLNFGDYATGGDDLVSFGVGGLIGFSGFSIAAGYMNTDGDSQADEWAFDVGLGYSTGPWTIAGGYVHGEDDLTNDEYDYISLSVDYGIASGLNVYASVGFGDNDIGSGDDNDYTVLTTGIKTSF